jgi:DNA mismatch endonuclease, patch repair protein
MADVFSKRKRSEVMAAIRGRGNKSTEQAIRRLLRAGGLKGWRSHAKNLPGTPDFIFRKSKVAIFADGCFWHGCRKCGLRDRAATNRVFWRRKIARNISRDRSVSRLLRQEGWSVLRVWEHDLKRRPGHCVGQITRLISGRGN